MADELLEYYNDELAYIRELAGAFAKAHPSIAGQLRLGRDAVDDPHVERLIEAFAFLTSRVRRKLDDDIPELSDAVLQILYPHYLLPIPSITIVQFQPPTDLSGPYTLSRGSELLSETVDEARCRFRTAYPVTLWPIRLADARLAEKPYPAPPRTAAPSASAVLHLTFECNGDSASFTDLGLDSLRICLRGPHHQTMPLYEAIQNRVVKVAVAESVEDTRAVTLNPEAIKPVGFGEDEGLLPYPASSFSGYRLLTEYFAFPDKFLFFDVTGLDAKTLLGAGRTLHVFMFMSTARKDLQRVVSAEHFALGCTPAVNLFRQRAEPIRLTQTKSSYRVEADARRPHSVEVYTVDEVMATQPDGSQVRYAPFYGVTHAWSGSETAYWLSTRTDGDPERGGSEVHLSLTDVDLSRFTQSGATLSITTTCLNRDLPARLPFGGEHPAFELNEPGTAVPGITCMTPPTATLRPALGNGARWRLVSHLALNHLSLMGEDATEAFREILRLYDFREAPETQAVIDAVTRLAGRRGAARVPGRAGPVACQGVDVELELDPERFSSEGGYLLAAVIQRFLALHVAINGYTRLTARMKGEPRSMAEWAPQTGERTLI